MTACKSHTAGYRGSPASSDFSPEPDLLVPSIRPRRTPPPQPRSLLLVPDHGRQDPQTVPKRRVPKLDEEVIPLEQIGLLAPRRKHDEQDILDVQIRRHGRPLEPLLQPLHNLGLIEPDVGEQGNGLVRGEGDVAVVRTAVFGAIAESHHGRDDADGACGHVGDGQAGEDGGAFGEAVSFAHDVAASGRRIGDLLPAGYFGVDAVGPEAILECLGQNIRLQGKTLEGCRVYFVDVYDALLPTRRHFEDIGQTETFAFERALAIALHDDVGFFEELVEDRTVFLEVEVETAFAFADGQGHLKVLRRRYSSA